MARDPRTVEMMAVASMGGDGGAGGVASARVADSDKGVEVGSGVEVVGGVEAGTAAASAASDAAAGAAGVSLARNWASTICWRCDRRVGLAASSEGSIFRFCAASSRALMKAGDSLCEAICEMRVLVAGECF